MRIITFVLVGVLSACGFESGSHLQDDDQLGITDYKEAYQAAKEQEKPLLIYFERADETNASGIFEGETIPALDSTLRDDVIFARLPIDHPYNNGQLIDKFEGMRGIHGITYIPQAGTDIENYYLSFPFMRQGLYQHYKADARDFEPWTEEILSAILATTGDSKEEFRESFIELDVVKGSNYYNDLARDHGKLALDFATARIGQYVGGGGCNALTEAASRHATGDSRFGREVGRITPAGLTGEVAPGYVLSMHNFRYGDNRGITWTSARHFAMVESLSADGKILYILQQNVVGSPVRRDNIDLTRFYQGLVTVHEP